jgi:hypothetical protein
VAANSISRLEIMMALLTNQLDPAALAAELDETGFVCIENAIDPAWIVRGQALFRAELAVARARHAAARAD